MSNLFIRSVLSILSFGYFSLACADELIKQIQSVRVPATDQFSAIDMPLHVFKPDGDGPFKVLLFSHGRAASESERAAFSKPIPDGHVNFWLRRGFAVVAPIRPGYGPAGGPDRERSGSKVANRRCQDEGDLRPFLRHGVLAIKTAHDWVRAQAWAKKDAILLEGQSVGGLLTIVYGSTNPDGIRGFINFSGGAAGYPADRIGHSCSENQIREAATLAGKTNKTPSLWLYAENDGFWGSTAPEQWHTAFSQRSQVNSAFVLTPPIEGRDGHFLLNYGGKYWGTPVDNFLKSLSLGR